MIHFRERDGRVRTMTAAEFERVFGARYAPRLLAPEPPGRAPRLPGAACAEAARLGRALAAEETAATFIAAVSPEVGYGLFARRPLRAGRLIGEYAGRLTRDWARSVRVPADFNPYLLKYPFASAYAVDAREEGNETRFINHSAARANVRRVLVPRAGLVRVAFVAAAAVPAGAQLLLDYGAGYWRAAAPAELAP